MANRREFVAWGALSMGAVATGRAVAGGAAPQPQALGTGTADPLYAFIYDDRFPASAAFAAHAQARGERVRGLDNGDVTRLWYDDLYHEWKKAPVGIAGLTTPGALFVLETFGNDAGLRLQFKAEHRIQGHRVEHRLFGPDRMLRAALPLESSGNDWSAHMGRVMCSARSKSFARAEAQLTTQMPGGLPGNRDFLVSWVLAPRPLRFVTT